MSAFIESANYLSDNEIINLLHSNNNLSSLLDNPSFWRERAFHMYGITSDKYTEISHSLKCEKEYKRYLHVLNVVFVHQGI